MNNLQTKPLRPEWVDKLAEALIDEYEISEKVEKGISMYFIPKDELAEMIWNRYLEIHRNLYGFTPEK